MCGIGVFEFWDYTFGEILDLMDVYKQKKTETITNNYQLANLISLFINRANNGKQPPSLSELYPSIFQPEVEEQEVDNSWLIYKEQMIDFAENVNKRRDKDE